MLRSRNRNKKSKRYGSKTNRLLLKKAKKDESWTSKSPFGKDLLKIGIKNDLFKDSSSSTTYPWTRLAPLLDYNLIEVPRSRKGIPSLKLICSKKIAENADSLESSFLDTASWMVWRTVWEEILSLNNDSPRVFNLFAGKFFLLDGFKCHKLSLPLDVNLGSSKWQKLLKARNEGISSVIIPRTGNHRIENLFSNINVLEIVKFIHRLSYRPWVLLDVSLMTQKYDREDHLKLFNITNLIALDLSNSQIVDDLFLYNMSVSISKDGKLSKLTILKINNCPKVTSKGLQYLLCLSNDADARCSLSYIESDVKISSSNFATKLQNIKSELPDFIDGTRWFVLDDDSESKSIRKLPLALKLHCLYKHYSNRITKDPIVTDFPLYTTNSMSYLFLVRNSIVLDIMVHENTFTSAENDFEKLEEVWATRIHFRNLRAQSKIYCYVIDNKYEFLGQMPNIERHEENKKDDSVMFRASEKKLPLKYIAKPKRRRPVARKVDANLFFDM